MLTRHIALFLSLIFAVVLVQSGFCADIHPHHWDTQVRGLGEKNARARSFRLAVTGKKVVPALIHGIGATNWKERYWIGATLGQIGGASTKRPLLQLLSDRDWRVRLSALLGLTQAFGTSRNLPARTLATLQHDPSQRVRDAFHYVTGAKADYCPLRQMLSHLEGSDSRLEWSDPGLEHTHDVLSIQGTTVITNFDGPSLIFSNPITVVWLHGDSVFEQKLVLPEGWHLEPGGEGSAAKVTSQWRIKREKVLVIECHKSNSGVWNILSPALYRLVSNHWRLINPDLERYESADAGAYMFRGHRLYVIDCTDGRHNQGAPHPYALVEYRWRKGEIMHIRSRELEQPYELEQALNKFGVH